MTKQEQIEETCETIASIICEIYNPQCDEYEPHTCSHCYANTTKIGDFAEMLYNAGYRRVPENAVVLSKEEFAELQKQVDELKERLHWIWCIGVDYDGFEKSESLKELIDEMVELTQIESKDKE